MIAALDCNWWIQHLESDWKMVSHYFLMLPCLSRLEQAAWRNQDDVWLITPEARDTGTSDFEYPEEFEVTPSAHFRGLLQVLFSHPAGGCKGCKWWCRMGSIEIILLAVLMEMAQRSAITAGNRSLTLNRDWDRSPSASRISSNDQSLTWMALAPEASRRIAILNYWHARLPIAISFGSSAMARLSLQACYLICVRPLFRGKSWKIAQDCHKTFN